MENQLPGKTEPRSSKAFVWLFLALFLAPQAIVSGVMKYRELEWRQFQERAEVVAATVENIRERQVQKQSYDAQTKRTVKTSRTVYQVGLRWGDRRAVIETGKFPGLPEGATITAYSDKTNPLDVRVVGWNQNTISELFLRLGAAGMSIFFSIFAAVFYFAATKAQKLPQVQAALNQYADAVKNKAA
jgi:hypothetical protein